MTIRSLSIQARIAFFATALVGLALATSGCAAEAEETTAPSEADAAELRTSSILTIAFDDEGALFVPQFHDDAQRYHDGVQIEPRGVLSIENRGHSPRRVTVAFDGPPMLDPRHEIHTSRPLELAPGDSSQFHAPDSRGHYSFRCPTNDSAGSCRGLTLGDGSGEWRPLVSVRSP